MKDSGRIILLFLSIGLFFEFAMSACNCPIDYNGNSINGIFKDGDDCRKFHHCINGTGYPRYCPSGYHFKLSIIDTKYKICIPKIDSNCKLSDVPNQEDKHFENVPECRMHSSGTVGSDTNRNQYFICINKLGWRHTCPNETEYRPKPHHNDKFLELCREALPVIKPVDGGWSQWSFWGSCHPSCEQGKQMRVRQCNNPEPKGSGKYCAGSPTETRDCNNGPCSTNGEPSFMVSLSSDLLTSTGTMNFTSVSLNSGNMYNRTANKVQIKKPGIYFFSLTVTTLKDFYASMFGNNLIYGFTRKTTYGGDRTTSRGGFYLLDGSKTLSLFRRDSSFKGSITGRETSWQGFLYPTDAYLICLGQKLINKDELISNVSASKYFRPNSRNTEYLVQETGYYFLNLGIGFKISSISYNSKTINLELERYQNFAYKNNIVTLTMNSIYETYTQISKTKIVHLNANDVIKSKIKGSYSNYVEFSNTNPTYFGLFKLNKEFTYFLANETTSTCNEFRRINLKYIHNDTSNGWSNELRAYTIKKAGNYYIELTFTTNSDLEVRMFLNNEIIANMVNKKSYRYANEFSRSLVLDVKEGDKLHWENHGCISNNAKIFMLKVS